MKEKPVFSIVVPVYNAEKTLRELYNRVNETFVKMNKSFEMIFVNDCSKDHSLDELNKLKEIYDNITIIELSRNAGQQNALISGFQYCSGDFIVTIDDDLQNPPEEIPKLYSKIQEGYDAVFGEYHKKEDKLYKNIGSKFFRSFNHKIFKLDRDLKFSSFRLIKRDIIDQIKESQTPFPYISGMILEVTDNVINTYVDHVPRKLGRSGYNLAKLVNLSFNLLINYSSIPLRFFSYIGLLISLISFCIGIFFIIKKILGGQPPTGWTSLVVLISFYNTIILLIFFILGEYISRILKEVSKHKAYKIKRVIK